MRRYGTIGIVIALLLLVAGLVPARPAAGQSTTCKIIFRSNRGGSYGLWVYHIDSDTFEQVNYEDSYSPSWNPDGTRFAFWLDNDVYTSKYDGTDRQTIYDASTVNYNSINWMADGRVSFWALDPSYYFPFIWDGSSYQRHTFVKAGYDTSYYLLDCISSDCVISYRSYTSGRPYYIYFNASMLYGSDFPRIRQAVLWGSKIYYYINSNINRMDTDGNNDEIFVNQAERIRFSNGWYTIERSNEIYYSDGGPTLIQITNDAYDDSQPDIYCGSPPSVDPTPTPPGGTGGGDDGGTGVISGDISITIPDIDIGYTLPTATASLTETDTPDYQGAMRSIADGASALFDFSEPPAQLLTTLVLVVILTQVGMFIKAFARWRHGR